MHPTYVHRTPSLSLREKQEERAVSANKPKPEKRKLCARFTRRGQQE